MGNFRGRLYYLAFPVWPPKPLGDLQQPSNGAVWILNDLCWKLTRNLFTSIFVAGNDLLMDAKISHLFWVLWLLQIPYFSNLSPSPIPTFLGWNSILRWLNPHLPRPRTCLFTTVHETMKNNHFLWLIMTAMCLMHHVHGYKPFLLISLPLSFNINLNICMYIYIYYCIIIIIVFATHICLYIYI